MSSQWSSSSTCPTGVSVLTADERRICELAARGRSNAEIAALLDLPRRTVGTHLTSGFHKLGVRRRTQLAEQLTAGPSPAAP
ncbi:helix-turn-helix transcriptional regulator [Streptomyces sp. G-G2]|uniref:response regulator transcription factor n=1 Tax=Streptomyces sp. G-G2 TaxID=3046201 RepID=UPI0032D91B6D